MKIQSIRDRWRNAPLAVAFATYLVVYLALATILTAWLVNVVFGDETQEFVIALVEGDNAARLSRLHSGPYIYDEESNRLLPASELPVPGASSSQALFFAVSPGGSEADGAGPEGDSTGQDGADDGVGATVTDAKDDADAGDEASGAGGTDAPSGFSAGDSLRAEWTVTYATCEDVRQGSVDLYDWGLNYPNEGMLENVLENGKPIAYDDLAAYDRWMRGERIDPTPAVSGLLTSGLITSNVGYYASNGSSHSIWMRAIFLIEGLTPFLTYGGLGWIMFRRFYRVYIAGPLTQLSAAAERIGDQDLDFELRGVRGRELGKLGRTMEGMRGSLLAAQRKLWCDAEDRRRLNAAFAHDLRTPVTVLKGTVEMARMKALRGEETSMAQLDAMAGQVERLAAYARAMGGLSRLEDRPLELRCVDGARFFEDLRLYACDVVRSYNEGEEGRESGEDRAELELSFALGDERAADGSDGHGEGGELAGLALCVDVPLIEEVLGNLLRNACSHAHRSVCVDAHIDAVQASEGEVAGRLMSERGYGRGTAPSMSKRFGKLALPKHASSADVCPPSARPAVLTLVVTDDGPGFSSEALVRGCESFYSENKSATHFGLGLNIARTLARLHGGDIRLENAPEGGARVTATFACEVETSDSVQRPAQRGEIDGKR